MGQVIKSVCVSQSVYLSVLAVGTLTPFLIDFRQNWHRRKNPQKGRTSLLGSMSHHTFPYFAPQNYILGQEVLNTHANIK